MCVFGHSNLACLAARWATSSLPNLDDEGLGRATPYQVEKWYPCNLNLKQCVKNDGISMAPSGPLLYQAPPGVWLLEDYLELNQLPFWVTSWYWNDLGLDYPEPKQWWNYIIYFGSCLSTVTVECEGLWGSLHQNNILFTQCCRV